MRNMRINKSKIYIRPFLKNKEGYGTAIYGDAFPFNENVYPIDGNDEIKDYGDRIFKTYKSTPSKLKWKGKIKEGDIAYLDGVLPSADEINGQKANYKITSVRETKNSLLIIFERT